MTAVSDTIVSRYAGERFELGQVYQYTRKFEYTGAVGVKRAAGWRGPGYVGSTGSAAPFGVGQQWLFDLSHNAGVCLADILADLDSVQACVRMRAVTPFVEMNHAPRWIGGFTR